MKALLRLLLLAMLCLGTPVLAGTTKQNTMTIADTVTDLRSLNAISNPSDLSLVYLRATKSLYGWDPNSVASDNGTSVIASNWNTGPGRWVLVVGSN